MRTATAAMSGDGTGVVRHSAGKYLTFALGDEEFGLEILKVREIIGCMQITAIPQTPVYVKGVINLRGQIISVVDLRCRLGLESVERTEASCIIVVETRCGRAKVNIGLIVDRVREVLNITGEQIEPPPSIGGAVAADFILGMGKIGDRVNILLDIDRVLGDVSIAGSVAAAEAA